MRALRALWLTPLIHALFLISRADQHSCNSEASAATCGTQADATSLLQSRGVRVDYADDNEDSGPELENALEELAGNGANLVASTAFKPTSASDTSTETVPDSLLLFKADKASMKHLLRHRLEELGAGWYVALTASFMLCLCCLFYPRLFNHPRYWKEREDALETRVISVLHPQRIGEELVQPLGDTGFSAVQAVVQAAGARNSPMVPQRAPAGPFTAASTGWGFGSSSSAQNQAQSSLREGASVLHDMPPPLVSSSPPLDREVELLIAKDQVITAAREGGDIMLLAPNGALLLRATVRKIDMDSWLEVAMQVEGGAPSAMVKLTTKEVPKAAYFSQPDGPEIFGPDGGLYGMVELNRMGTARLISSTTGQPLLNVDGDTKTLQLTIRTKGGLELAKVASNGSTSYLGDVKICVHTGADLALMISLVLTVILSGQT